MLIWTHGRHRLGLGPAAGGAAAAGEVLHPAGDVPAEVVGGAVRAGPALRERSAAGCHMTPVPPSKAYTHSLASHFKALCQILESLWMLGAGLRFLALPFQPQ